MPSSAKESKAEADYRAGHGEQRCANCVMFRAPSSCTKVEGAISPDAQCDYFEPKTVAHG